jgi:glycosyltransferase involved in cell wall biosynthesis
MMEAMSIGVPVVASAHGGPTELLGEGGVLVPPGDATALARALDTILEDTDLRRRCRDAGRRRVEADLVLEDRTAELFGMLVELAERPARTAG